MINWKFYLFLLKSLHLIPKYFKQNKLTVNNVKNFIIGNKRLFEFESKDLHFKEQVWYRLLKAHNECKVNKQCPCTCPLIGKVQLDQACERNCYPILMDNQVWEVYKKIHNITDFDFQFGKSYLKNNFEEI